MLNYTTPNVFYTPLRFYTTKIISSFLNSRISANHDKVGGLSANGKILIKGVVSLLRNLFCFIDLMYKMENLVDFMNDTVLSHNQETL